MVRSCFLQTTLQNSNSPILFTHDFKLFGFWGSFSVGTDPTRPSSQLLQLQMTSPLWAPPAPNYPPPYYFRPYDGPRHVIHVLFPRGSDLVRSIENQIPTASFDEIFSIAQFLAEKGLVGNPSIAGIAGAS